MNEKETELPHAEVRVEINDVDESLRYFLEGQNYLRRATGGLNIVVLGFFIIVAALIHGAWLNF